MPYLKSPGNLFLYKIIPASFTCDNTYSFVYHESVANRTGRSDFLHWWDDDIYRACRGVSIRVIEHGGSLIAPSPREKSI